MVETVGRKGNLEVASNKELARKEGSKLANGTDSYTAT